MYEILTTAGGVLLAFFVLRAIDWIKDAPARAHQRKMDKAVGEAVGAFMDHLASPEHAEHVAQAQKAAKKPARRKPAAKKPVTKKGASNAKATTQRSSAARRS